MTNPNYFENKSPKQQLDILKFAIDAANNCVSIVDATLTDMPLIYVNKGFTNLTGYSYEEAIGKNCRFLQNNDTKQAGLVRLRQAIRSGEDVQVVIRNYRKDGSMFWNELFLSSIYDENGKLAYFMGVQNDVTQRYKLEQGLQEAIEASLRDATWLTQSILDKLVQARSGFNAGDMPSFSDREFVVLELLAKGLSNIDIAQELDLSINTVRNYIAALYDKLNLRTRVEVVVWAHERGIGLARESQSGSRLS